MDYTLEIPDSLTAKLAALGYDNPLNGLHAATKLLVGLGPEAWATITRGADAQGISPAKFVLAQMERPDTPSETPAKAQRRQSNDARDNQIADEYFTGTITYPKLAAKHRLSVVRITQIVAKVRAVRGLQPTQTPTI